MNMTDDIRRLLAGAHDLDRLARDCRREAGKLLAEARSERPTGSAWHQAVGLDQRSAELLIEMHAGSRPR